MTKVSKLTMSAVFAALTCTATMLIKIPVPATQGYIHFGDAFVFLAGIFPGGFYGVILDITDDVVIVEFGNNKNCRIPMKKEAIAEVEKADASYDVSEKK